MSATMVMVGRLEATHLVVPTPTASILLVQLSIPRATTMIATTLSPSGADENYLCNLISGLS